VLVRERCARNKVACHTFQDYLLIEPDQVPVRKVFTPFYLLWQQLPKQLPEKKPLPETSFPKNLPSLS
jgi:deoxyribodipyrimidine photolyase